MMLKEAILDAIRDSWSGESVPSPYPAHRIIPADELPALNAEYARGQFELAVQLLGYDGEAEMSDAIEKLWKEARA